MACLHTGHPSATRQTALATEHPPMCAQVIPTGRGSMPTGDGGIVLSSAILPGIMPTIAMSSGSGGTSPEPSFNDSNGAEPSSFERRRATLAQGSDRLAAPTAVLPAAAANLSHRRNSQVGGSG